MVKSYSRDEVDTLFARLNEIYDLAGFADDGVTQTKIHLGLGGKFQSDLASLERKYARLIGVVQFNRDTVACLLAAGEEVGAAKILKYLHSEEVSEDVITKIKSYAWRD